MNRRGFIAALLAAPLVPVVAKAAALAPAALSPITPDVKPFMTSAGEQGLIAWWPLDDATPAGAARRIVNTPNGRVEWLEHCSDAYGRVCISDLKIYDYSVMP